MYSFSLHYATIVVMSIILITICCTLTYLQSISAIDETKIPPWGYECENSRCVKIALDSNDRKAVSLPVCRLFCGNEPGTLWPKPTGPIRLSNFIAKINPGTVTVRANDFQDQEYFWEENENRFLEQLRVKVPKTVQLPQDGKNLIVNVKVKSEQTKLTMMTDESYELRASEKSGDIVAHIKAETIFGARHGLETLAQLIVFDDIRQELQVGFFVH